MVIVEPSYGTLFIFQSGLSDEVLMAWDGEALPILVSQRAFKNAYGWREKEARVQVNETCSHSLQSLEVEVIMVIETRHGKTFSYIKKFNTVAE